MLFALTSALSALLLFWMQPLVARLVLPLFGGTPQVWTTSLLFFQVVLLCGYLLAHRLQKLPVRAQVAIQVSLLALALCFPLRLPADPPDAEGHGVGAVLLLLARMAGPGALALSVHAPLLQRWFARASPLRNPYPLYAASNVGSFLALAAFPFVLEPLLGISRQSTAWSGAYALLLLCVGACGLRAIRAPAADHSLLNDVDSSVNAPSAAQASAARAPASLTWPQRLRWMALAAVPTSLLSGVTAHLATDVASIPLLWILPLAIYLLTYIIAFAGPADSEGPKRLLLGAQAVALAVLVAIVPARSVQASLLVDLSAFGLTALLCHRELSRTKPAPALLTEFYLLISFGSVLGGAFNALVAPVVFVTVAEYPIALVAAVFLRPTDAPIFARVKTLLLECLGPALLTGLALVIVQQRGADTEVMHAALWKWLVFA
ncbi:MAG: class I SAM-dependent methyltransferase, partial [Deltaproteobacteria bacterium]|nr:class I SAM-dependent methyltransferase [Deltaproteobacteria bacterium]